MKTRTLLATATLLMGCAKTAPPPPPSAKIARHATLVEQAEAALHDDMPVDYALPFVERSDRREHRVTAWLRACDAGDKPSCWKAVQTAEPSRRPALVKRVEANCAAGNMLSCRALADAWDKRYSKFPGAAEQSEACLSKEDSCDRVALRADCLAGFPRSCLTLSVLKPPPPDADALFARVDPLVRAGCEAAIVDDCRWISTGITEQIGPEHTLCDLYGMCGDVGRRAAEEGKLIEARDAYERNCQYNFDDASRCLGLALDYLDHRWPEPVPGRGHALLDWVCFRLEATLDRNQSIVDVVPQCAPMTPHVRR